MKLLFRIRKLGSYINFSILPAFLLVLVMIATSLIFKSQEIILPELSALSIGCFVYKIPHWTSKPILLFTIPTGTALIGFLINQLEIPLFLKLILVLIAMFLFLKIVKSNLAPSLATGLLPVITNCQSIYFIASILVFTFLLFLIVRFFYKNNALDIAKEKTKLTLPFILLLIVWILACQLLDFPAMFAIPPIIVVGFEYIQVKNYNISMTVRHILALFLSAVIGTFTVLYFPNLIWSLVVDFIIVTLILKIFNVKLPPAYAMAILPMVLADHLNIYFPVYVIVMSTIVFSVIILLKKRSAV